MRQLTVPILSGILCSKERTDGKIHVNCLTSVSTLAAPYPYCLCIMDFSFPQNSKMQSKKSSQYNCLDILLEGKSFLFCSPCYTTLHLHKVVPVSTKAIFLLSCTAPTCPTTAPFSVLLPQLPWTACILGRIVSWIWEQRKGRVEFDLQFCASVPLF